ncbi:hypothetical protein IW261DRAFT_1419404 [Armillaria novae-zelandiae]|uniref:Uncharacterized protein n=1 Tax=Armillaria novae-zelandiae TaxID=153914 RepID=A0AA39PAC9_9AGAR|nr:hypothetical protein IW261DRAFT_1419404 [Armillaria novae-zelandiae]
MAPNVLGSEHPQSKYSPVSLLAERRGPRSNNSLTTSTSLIYSTNASTWYYGSIPTSLSRFDGYLDIKALHGTKQQMKKRKRQPEVIVCSELRKLPAPLRKPTPHNKSSILREFYAKQERHADRPDTPGSDTSTQQLLSELHAGIGSWPLPWCSYVPDTAGSTVTSSTSNESKPLLARNAHTQMNQYIATSYGAQHTEMNGRCCRDPSASKEQR